MNCDPNTLIAEANCFRCLPPQSLREVMIYLMCQWTNKSTAPTVPVNTALPAITGTVQVSYTLSGSNGTWTNTPTSYTYQWYANGVAIAGATTNTFLLTTAQAGAVITFQVTAINAGGSSVPATSTATAAVLTVALFTVTTTAPTQTLNIAALTTSSSMTVDWGDGNQNAYNGANTPSHTYAAAGTYTVKFLAPLLVTVLHLSDAKCTLNSVGIASLTNLTGIVINSISSGTFNSSDISAWRPTSFSLTSMGAGYLGTFNSSDISAWRPSMFSLHNLPAGYLGTFNSSDISAWRPTDFYLGDMPGGYAGTFNSSDISAWRPTVEFWLTSMPAGYLGSFSSSDISAWSATPTIVVQYMPASYSLNFPAGGLATLETVTALNFQADALTQAQVNQILTECYTAFASRTATGGSINLSGAGNGAPSGIFQANCPPTSGKETAYDLLNDPCSVNPTHKWATVTTN